MRAFLGATHYAGWTRVALAGDASSRRYFRLSDPAGDETAILMDAPPDLCGSQSAFVDIAGHLRGIGLSAPEILAQDVGRGFLLLEDLGQVDFRRWLDDRPDEEGTVYADAVDVLVRVGASPPPDGLRHLTPETGAAMLDPLFDWALPECPTDLARAIRDEVARLIATHALAGPVLSLRDFHAENLIWRPDRQGLARVGLLDFQDAFLADPAYDLASLLRDLRRDVSEMTVTAMIERFADATGHKVAAIEAAMATLSAQRNLRIWGIFTALARRDGRTGYLALLPRLQAHLHRDLSHPALHQLRDLVEQARETAEAAP